MRLPSAINKHIYFGCAFYFWYLKVYINTWTTCDRVTQTQAQCVCAPCMSHSRLSGICIRIASMPTIRLSRTNLSRIKKRDVGQCRAPSCPSLPMAAAAAGSRCSRLAATLATRSSHLVRYTWFVCLLCTQGILVWFVVFLVSIHLVSLIATDGIFRGIRIQLRRRNEDLKWGFKSVCDLTAKSHTHFFFVIC